MSERDDTRNKPLIPREVIERVARKMRTDCNRPTSIDMSAEATRGLVVRDDADSADPDAAAPTETQLPPSLYSLKRNSSKKISLLLSGRSKAAKIAKRNLMRVSRKARADLLREQNTIFRHNRKLGFAIGYRFTKKQKFGVAPPLQGGLCNGK